MKWWTREKIMRHASELIIAMVLLVGVAALMTGCQWGTFTEKWTGPAVKAATNLPADGDYYPVGVGEWRDERGNVCRGTVYARRTAGAKGPSGATGRTTTEESSGGYERHERTEVRIMAPAPSRPVKVTPLVAGESYDANTGTYQRRIEVTAPIWGDAPGKVVSAVEPFKTRDARTPSYESRGFAVGEGRGGSFTGGDMESWKDVVSNGTNLIVVFGGLVFIGGILIAVLVKQWVLGLATAGAGLALMAAGVMFATYPWIAPLAMLALVAVGAWRIFKERSDKATIISTSESASAKATALDAIVRGVETAPAEVAAAVKAAISNAATASKTASKVKDVITEAKKEAGV